MSITIRPRSIRRRCPKCGKPLLLGSPLGGKGPHMWWCTKCDPARKRLEPAAETALNDPATDPR